MTLLVSDADEQPSEGEIVLFWRKGNHEATLLVDPPRTRAEIVYSDRGAKHRMAIGETS